MAHIGKAQSAIWTRFSRSIDLAVVACMAVVAATGAIALSPPAPATQASVIVAEISPSPAPKAPSVRQRNAQLQPEYFPWRGPETYTPVLPEAPKPVIPNRPQDAFLTRMRGQTPFRPSTHDNHASHYGGNWREDNVTETTSGTLLSIHRVKGESMPYTIAELQSPQKYGYGRYEVIMRPARGSGTVSAFFTYTGPHFGDPHDEVDIEFLGQDTTKVHFNYFRKGKRGAFENFDLPFDAADADRLYAFEWTPDRITWFIEGQPIYATPTGDPGIPAAPSKIMMSAWVGKPFIEGWTGKPTFTSGTGAHYSCVSFVPMGGTGPSCSDNYTPPVVLSP